MLKRGQLCTFFNAQLKILRDEVDSYKEVPLITEDWLSGLIRDGRLQDTQLYTPHETIPLLTTLWLDEHTDRSIQVNKHKWSPKEARSGEEIFNLYRSDLSIQQISQKLGCSVSTVKRRLKEKYIFYKVGHPKMRHSLIQSLYKDNFTIEA